MTRSANLRRHLVTALCALAAFGAGIAVERASGQDKPRMWADVLLNVTARDIPTPTRVRVNTDHWEPGAETGRHSHPGPALLVILDGELVETFADGRTRALKAGQAVWNAARTEHNVRNAGARPARAIAVHLDPGK
jgi:quercetin dioxygenase-like cupin family protein